MGGGAGVQIPPSGPEYIKHAFKITSSSQALPQSQVHRADIEPSDKNPPKIKFENSLKLMDHTSLNDTLFIHLAETDVLNVAFEKFVKSH